MIRLFDSHCHLQDPRILNMVPRLINETLDIGVTHFAVNGVSEKDWHLVKEMSESYPCVIPNFGLHPWRISSRTSQWITTLKDLLIRTPCAAVGEIGLDKGSIGRQVDFTEQIEVFRLQLRLAKELKRPASIHCVRAFGDLLEVLKSEGPFPSGLVLHSYLGSAEMVTEFCKLGAYFSFSGFLMSMKESKAKKMLRAVPTDRILLETDAPDAKPSISGSSSLFFVTREESDAKELVDDSPIEGGESSRSCNESLNHPANIRLILSYVAGLLEMGESELADLSYKNAFQLFSYDGSKLVP